jgi:hypothetical protein
MKQRCTNPNNARWKNYGERGITYTEDWETFEGFYKDMGERPLGLSLERVDVNGNYCKENCVWATPQQQVRNQTRRCTNTSKRTGVRWVKEKKLWLANITINYKAVFFRLLQKF